MCVPRQFILITCAAVLLATACGPVGANYGYRKGFSSWNDKLWKNIQRQQFDYSCGAAALATIGKHYFGDPVNETLVLYVLVNQLNRDALKDREKNGFSLLDLRMAAAQLGYNSASVILHPHDIELLDGPVIVILNDGILDHFVVLKGKDGNTVYLADSARGNITMPMWLFLEQWKSRTALVLGKTNFGIITEHGLAIEKHTGTNPERNAVRQHRSKRAMKRF